MKAFLLAAGNGTRLRPLTDSLPKCMVPIQGRPLLGIWLEWCRLYGIEEVLINVHAHADRVTEYLQGDFGIRIHIAREAALLGSAGTLHTHRDFVAGEPSFAILYADVLTNCNFARMRTFHNQRKAPATLGLYHAPNPAECGIAELDGEGRIIEFVEKPARPRSDLAFTGVMIAGPQVMEALAPTIPADIGSSLLPLLVGRMYGFPLDGFLLDIGSPEKYQRAQREWPGLPSALPKALAAGR